jgi:hypothetical protein
MRIVRFVGMTLLLAGGLFYHLDRASAQGSDAARQACAPDAVRLCNDFIPDVAKITACMKEKRAQLSEPCRVVMYGGGGGHGGHHYRHYRHSRHST